MTFGASGHRGVNNRAGRRRPASRTLAAVVVPLPLRPLNADEELALA